MIKNEPEARHLEPLSATGRRNLEPGTLNQKPGTRNPMLRLRSAGQNPKIETRNFEPGTLNPEPITSTGINI